MDFDGTMLNDPSWRCDLLSKKEPVKFWRLMYGKINGNWYLWSWGVPTCQFHCKEATLPCTHLSPVTMKMDNCLLTSASNYCRVGHPLLHWSFLFISFRVTSPQHSLGRDPFNLGVILRPDSTFMRQMGVFAYSWGAGCKPAAYSWDLSISIDIHKMQRVNLMFMHEIISVFMEPAS